MPRSVAFIFTPAQLYEIERAGVLNARRMTVATAHVDVIAGCLDHGVPVEDLTAYLRRGGESFGSEAMEICRRLAGLLEEELPDKYRRLAIHTTVDLLYPLVWFLQTEAMIANFLATASLDQSFVFADDPPIEGWDPRPIPHETANLVARWVLERRHVPIQLLTLRSRGREKTERATRARAVANREQSSWPRIECAPVVSLAAVMGGIGEAEQANLSRVAESPSRGAMARVPGAMFSLVPLKPLIRADHVAFCIERVVERARAEKIVPDVLARNPYMSGLWRAWAGYLQSGLSSFAQALLIVDTFRPKVVITAYDVFGHTRCLTEALLSRGVTTVSVHHSGIDVDIVMDALRHHSAVGHIVGWSEWESQYISRYRSAGSRYRAIGSLRPDVQRALESIQSQPRIARRSEGNPAVLFLSSKVADYVPIGGVLGKHVRTWQALREYCKRRTDLSFSLKKHPRYDYDEIYGAVGEAESPGSMTLIHSLVAAIAKADLVVLVNVVSTAILDAVCARKPVILLDTLGYCSRNEWLSELGIDVIQDVQTLERRVDELLAAPEQVESLVARLQANLQKYVVATGRDAASRLWQFVEELRPDVWEPAEPAARNPVSLWCWGFARVADCILRGERDEAEAGLAARFPDDTEAEASCLVDLPQLAPRVFHQVLWKLQDQWGPPAAEIIRRVHRLLPEKYRLPFRALRPYLVQAFLLDAKDGRRSFGCRVYSRIAVYALAPGRLFDLKG